MATAFQANAFQNNAFQSGVSLVAGNYWLGSPSFVAPVLTVKRVLSAASYSLGPLDIAKPGRYLYTLSVNPYSLNSPVFATPGPIGTNYVLHAASYSLGSPAFYRPPLLASGNLKPLLANPYSLGSPAFARPFVRQTNGLRVNAYWLGSPVFGTRAIGLNYRLHANFYWLASPSFATPQLGANYQHAVNAYSLAPLAFGPAASFHLNQALTVNAYSLSLAFGYPRLQYQVVDIGLPPTYYTDAETAANVLATLCNYLLASLPAGTSNDIVTARRLTATLRDSADAEVRGVTLGTDLQAVYLACDKAGASYAGIDAASMYLFGQASTTTTPSLTQMLYQSALVMNLALEVKLISRTSFTNQAQIQDMMVHVQGLFEWAKAIGIDDVDVTVYQAIIAMGGAIMNHLNYTELQLPRYMTYVSDDVMPSLYLANRIYADASRSDEIEEENDVVNPAFMPRTIRVLSNVGR